MKLVYKDGDHIRLLKNSRGVVERQPKGVVFNVKVSTLGTSNPKVPLLLLIFPPGSYDHFSFYPDAPMGLDEESLKLAKNFKGYDYSFLTMDRLDEIEPVYEMKTLEEILEEL